MLQIRRIITPAFVVTTVLGCALLAHAQQARQQVFLTITDPAAGAKIMSLLKGANSTAYHFEGVRALRGKSVPFSTGRLSMSDVQATAVRAGVSLTPVGNNAVVHSTLTDFFAKNRLAEIQAILQGVDKSLYTLDVVAAH